MRTRGVLTALFLLGVGIISARAAELTANPFGLFNGGGSSSNGAYTFTHTIGQQTVGAVSGGSYRLALGFEGQVIASDAAWNQSRRQDFAGFPHAALNSATVSSRSNQLQVSNLGGSGQDGVGIALGRVDGWRADLIHQLGASNRANGSRIEWTVLGVKDSVPDQPIIRGRLERGETGVALYANGELVGAPMFEVQVRSNGVVLAQGTVNSGRVAILRPASGATAGLLGVIQLVWQGLTGPNDGWCSWTWYRHYVLTEGQPISQACDVGFDDPTTPGGDIFISGADTLRIRPVNMTADIGTFSRVELRGANSGDFWLRDEAIGLLGHWHRSLAGALLNTGETPATSALRINNLSSSGEDGFEVIAGGDELWDDVYPFYVGRIVQAWPDDWEMPWLTASNSHVRWTAAGQVQGSSNSFENLSHLTASRQGSGTTFAASFASFLGVTHVEVDVFHAGRMVAMSTVPVGDLGVLSGTGEVHRVGFHHTETLCWRLAFEGEVTFTPREGPAMTGTFLRFGALNPQATVLGLRSLATRAANVESLGLNQIISAPPPRPRLALVGQGVTPRLLIPSDGQTIYTIEAAEAITGPWAPLGVIGGREGEADFTDAEPAPVYVRFYRVRGD